MMPQTEACNYVWLYQSTGVEPLGTDCWVSCGCVGVNTRRTTFTADLATRHRNVFVVLGRQFPRK